MNTERIVPCRTCNDTGWLLLSDAGGESAYSQACPDCDTPYPPHDSPQEFDHEDGTPCLGGHNSATMLCWDGAGVVRPHIAEEPF